MFENLGWPEILLLLLIALFILGPERLPKILRDVGNMLRKVRRMATDATADLNRDLGTDLDITDLNPKTFIRKHVLSEEDEETLKKPLLAAFEDLKRDTEDLRKDADDVRGDLRDTAAAVSSRRVNGSSGASAAISAGGDAGESASSGEAPANGEPGATRPPVRSYDDDAT